MHSMKDRFLQDAAPALGRFKTAMIGKHGSPEAAMRKMKEDHGDPFSLSQPALEALAGERHTAAGEAMRKAAHLLPEAGALEGPVFSVLSDGFSEGSIRQRARLISETLSTLPAAVIEAGKFNDAYDAWTALAELKDALLDVPDRRLGRTFARVALKTRPSKEKPVFPPGMASRPVVVHFAPFPSSIYFPPVSLDHEYRRVELGDRWVRAGIRATVAVLSIAAASGIAYAYSNL